MTGLVEWLLAVLDEHEEVARAASPGPWTYGDIDSVAGGMIYDPTVAIASVDYDVEPGDPRIRRDRPVEQADATGQHIALHDPAAVLTDIAAKRAILAIHKQPGWAVDQFACRACSAEGEYPGAGRYPCPTVRALASAYSHWPGYLEEWKPLQ